LRDSASFAYAFAFALSLLFLIGLPANSSFFENSFVYFPVNEYIIRTKNKPDEMSIPLRRDQPECLKCYMRIPCLSPACRQAGQAGMCFQ
jgi:hypothetical protein